MNVEYFESIRRAVQSRSVGIRKALPRGVSMLDDVILQLTFDLETGVPEWSALFVYKKARRAASQSHFGRYIGPDAFIALDSLLNEVVHMPKGDW
jgi:hypothetical protein